MFDEWVLDLSEEFQRWGYDSSFITNEILEKLDFWNTEYYLQDLSPKQTYYEWCNSDE